ncbi:MAG: transporter [Bacteroidia bacterium]|nr:transporter [Bacteroidia bacterium]
MKKIILIFLLFSSFRAFTQIETDRPDFTESPNTVPKGALQVETGVIIENDKIDNLGGSIEYLNFTLNTTLIRYGLLENLELRFNWANNRNEETQNRLIQGGIDSNFSSVNSGFETSFVGFKTNLFKKDKISIGFLGHLYIPDLSSGDFKADNQKVASELLFPISCQITERFGMAAQYGINWDGFSPNPTTSYTLSFGYAITDQLNCYLEPYGFLSNNGEELHFVNGGFTYLVNDNFQLDLTGGFGLNEEATDNFISCGASFLLFNK